MGGTLRWQTCSTSDFPLKRKVIEACQPCRTKKMRCDGNQPCSRCIKYERQCEYKTAAPSTRNNNDNINKKKKPPSFQWTKLSFHQDFYVALNPTSKSEKLPPLFFEFYHLTAQPITIWTRLHFLFQKWSRSLKPASLKSIRIPFVLAKEAVHLFMEYNTLYSLFIDPTDIVVTSDSLYPSSDNTAASLLLDTILALTFLAAGQTLGSDLLLVVARCFYDTIHQRWLALTFPSVESNEDGHLKLLTQTSILLVHFQCTDICEEQAYMTCRIAQGCLERLVSMGSQLNHEMVILQYTLYAWQVWFALYLYGSQVSLLKSPSTLVSFYQEQQNWTLSVLTRYTSFLASLLKSNQDQTLTTQDLMIKSQSLLSLSTNQTCPEQLVSLYHATLTLQLYSSQWRPDLNFFTQQDIVQDIDNDSKKLCIKTSQQIIEIATMMTGQESHRSSLVLSTKYRALCLAITILAPTSFTDFLQPLTQIFDQDMPICPMARQCLYYLHQRLPTIFPDDPLHNDGNEGQPWQRHRPGLRKLHHIDQEQLKKLTVPQYGGKRGLNDTTIDYSRKRYKTAPPTQFWIPPESSNYMTMTSTSDPTSLLTCSSLLMSPSWPPPLTQQPTLSTFPMVHQSSSSSTSSTSSVFDHPPTRTKRNDDPTDWLYYLYQHQNHLNDDAYMIFSSSLPSIPRK